MEPSIDRDKVIKEFELFIKEFHPACTSEGVELDMFGEVLALLKEQEAVKPIKMQRMDDNFSFFVPYFLCGNCRYELAGEDVMFCAHCGKAVKWGD